MTPVELLLSKLPHVKPCGKGWSARCPAHDDRRASLSIAEGEDGTALAKCHAGCATSAIVETLGLKLADLFPRQATPKPRRKSKLKASGPTFPNAEAALAELGRRHGKHSAVWAYQEDWGELAGLVVRWDRAGGKDIRPAARHPDGWRIEAMPDPRPLYRLPELTKAERVIVVEGEKAADAARSLGFIATTSAGGCNAPHKSDWRPLAGKELWILPDNNPPGRKYAETVAGIGATLIPAPVVRIIELPGLPEGGDIVDWIDAHGDAAEPDGMREEIEAMANAVVPHQVGELEDLIYRPFPVDALPEPIRGFVVAGAKAIVCDPSYLALPLLVAVASAIGNTRRLELKRGWLAPPILWGAIVADSGTAKTPAFKAVMQPVRDRQGEALKQHAQEIQQHENELARWEREMTVWKRAKDSEDKPPERPRPPQAERFIVSDTTVEALVPILLANPRGVLLARDELAGWIGSFDRYSGKGQAGADASNWLSMFNAESIIVDRKTGTPRTVYVREAAVCVSGGIQPGVLRRALGIEHRESGLAARLLLAYPPRAAKQWTDADIDPAREAELAQLIDRLFEMQPAVDEDEEPRPVLVRLTAQAKSAWTAYYNAHAVEQAELIGDLSAAWSKLEEYAARLALVVHFARWADRDSTLESADWVDASSMEAGIRLARWFKHEARRVYAMLTESDAERDQRRLADWIASKGGAATARDVQMGCRWLREPGAAEAALEGLVRAGRGRWQGVETTPRGGRPTRVFTLTTASTSTEPDEPSASNGFC